MGAVRIPAAGIEGPVFVSRVPEMLEEDRTRVLELQKLTTVRYTSAMTGESSECAFPKDIAVTGTHAPPQRPRDVVVSGARAPPQTQVVFLAGGSSLSEDLSQMWQPE